MRFSPMCLMCHDDRQRSISSAAIDSSIHPQIYRIYISSSDTQWSTVYPMIKDEVWMKYAMDYVKHNLIFKVMLGLW